MHKLRDIDTSTKGNPITFIVGWAVFFFILACLGGIGWIVQQLFKSFIGDF